MVHMQNKKLLLQKFLHAFNSIQFRTSFECAKLNTVPSDDYACVCMSDIKVREQARSNVSRSSPLHEDERHKCAHVCACRGWWNKKKEERGGNDASLRSAMFDSARV